MEEANKKPVRSRKKIKCTWGNKVAAVKVLLLLNLNNNNNNNKRLCYLELGLGYARRKELSMFVHESCAPELMLLGWFGLEQFK